MVDQEKVEEDLEDEVYKEKYDMIFKFGIRV